MVLLSQNVAHADELEMPREARAAMQKLESDASEAWLVYVTALEKAKDTAVQALETEKQRIFRDGDLKTANALDAQLKVVQKKSVNDFLADVVGDLVPDAVLSSSTIRVRGTSSGEKIGKFTEGQKISIQYVRGNWGFGGSMGQRVVSPDEQGIHESARAVIVGPTGRTFNLPSGTRNIPYTLTLDSGGLYRLRMADTDRDNNRGTVTYKITEL